MRIDQLKKTMQPIKAFLFDIDGVLEYQGRACPGAIETLETLRQREYALRFVTNSTLKSRASGAAKLSSKGFTVFEEEVVTASYATAEYLRAVKPRSIWLMLQREGRDEFRDFIQDEIDPEIIVVGEYLEGFNYENLNRALRLLAKGARLVGMQNEQTDSSWGELDLNVGAWAGMLERASGVPAVYIGKPFTYAFELALRSLELSAAEVVMVGDRVMSDVLGAKNAGMRAVLIQNGEYRPEDLEAGIQPDWIIDDLRELLMLLPEPPDA